MHNKCFVIKCLSDTLEPDKCHMGYEIFTLFYIHLQFIKRILDALEGSVIIDFADVYWMTSIQNLLHGNIGICS